MFQRRYSYQDNTSILHENISHRSDRVINPAMNTKILLFSTILDISDLYEFVSYLQGISEIIIARNGILVHFINSDTASTAIDVISRTGHLNWRWEAHDDLETIPEPIVKDNKIGRGIPNVVLQITNRDILSGIEIVKVRLAEK